MGRGEGGEGVVRETERQGKEGRERGEEDISLSSYYAV